MAPRADSLLLLSFFVFSACAVDTRLSESGRPRGVSPEFAKFYKDSDTFTCLSNPSHKIPFSQVNDDYCDCPDGSDEPGTAACSYLSKLSPPQPHPDANGVTLGNESLALPGFYCKNKGHIPGYIRFESVNDGKCDYDKCCDGSDEYAHVGGVKCEDRCNIIGKEFRKKEESRQKSLGQALKRKKELLSEAERSRKELSDKIEATKIRVQGLERKLKESEEHLKDVEKREKLRIVKTTAGSKGTGKLGVLLSLAKERVEELRIALAKGMNQRDAMVARITELEQMLTQLKEQYNPNFNDEGVKLAVRSWEDYAAREHNDGWTEAEDRDVEEILKPDGLETGINWSEFDTSEDDVSSDVEALYQFTSYLPVAVQTWLDEKFNGLKQILRDNGVLPSSETGVTSPDSPAIESARRARDDTDRELLNANNELNRERDELNKDYGPSDIFRALKDKCFEKDSGEYVYSHCFLQKTTQKSKKGGGETIMGNFVGFDTEYVDDDLPVDGKGLGRGERMVLKYENGQHCWNGPNRSTRVVLTCNEAEEVWKISESEKCVYRMEIGTAAVCGWEKDKAANAETKKDEL